MKLIIQIPCYNEAETIGSTLAQLPRSLPGIDVIEWLIVDDGSADGTADIAVDAGADHVVRLPQNRGLARGFAAGLEAAIKQGADIIVNTDADNQYNASDIDKLVAPVLAKEADIVIGERPITSIQHFSRIKKTLQKWGSFVTRKFSRTDVQDAPSGFRAFSRSAARRLNVFSEYTYTLETIIQAGQNGMVVKSVPIRVNGETRPSRLVKSVFSYVKRSTLTMLRIFVVYRPLRFFLAFSVVSFLGGFALGLRYLYFHLIGEGGHVQSVILAALLIGASLLLFMIGLIADLISVNRRLLEKIQWRLGELEDRVVGRSKDED